MLNTRCASQSTGGALHVTGSSRKRDCNTASGSTASLDTLLNAVVNVDHAEVLPVGVGSAVDVEGGVVGGGEVLTIARGASDGRFSQVGRGVVDAQAVRSTAILRRVTSARREAVSEDTGSGSKGVGKRATTVALSGVLETSVVQTTVLAVRQTTLNGHVRGHVARVRQSTAADRVRSATNVVPTSDVLVVDGVVTKSSSIGAASLRVRGSARAVGDRVAAGQLLKFTGDGFVDGRSNDTGRGLGAGEEVEDRAISDETRVVVAGVGGLLKSGNIPAVEEITVEPVASRIALSEDERLGGTVPPIETGSRVDDFVEDGNHVNRVSCRARTVVVRVLGRVGHVRLVVGRVKVDTIPARGEENLGTQAIRADLVGKAASVRRGTAVVKADKADGLTGKVVATCTLERITSEHAETLGESGEVVVVGTTSLQVVNSHTTEDTLAITGLRDIDECAVLGLVVELGRPVVGHVLLDGA